MNLTVSETHLVYDKASIDEARQIWKDQDLLIHELLQHLRLSAKSRRSTTESELELWFEFLHFPFHLIHLGDRKDLQAYTVLHNILGRIPGFSADETDMRNGHRLLRQHYDFSRIEDIDRTLNYEEVRGYIIFQGVLQYVDSLDDAKTGKSRSHRMTHLMKMRLLYELGFFSLPKLQNLQSNTEWGTLLGLLLDADIVTMRKMAALVYDKDPKVEKRYDFYNENVKERLTKLLKSELPDLLLF